MKSLKMICAAAVLTSFYSLSAQNMYDAITFSRNEYFGSARSMALGNAVTAVGGDLGMIGINPAGSAVASYGQLVITPGVSISAVGSSYSAVGEESFGTVNKNRNSRSRMPNFGLSSVFTNYGSSALKSITLAVVSNQTADYNYYANAAGYNDRTSMAAEFANAAYDISSSILGSTGAYNSGSVTWDLLTAYQGGMFGSYGTDGVYAGITEYIDDTESYTYVPGTLLQNSVIQKWGTKTDLILNMGLNFSDQVYVGFNLGMPYASYGYSETFREAAVDSDQFPLVFNDSNGGQYTTYFDELRYNYRYLVDIEGIYGKIGFIYAPGNGLRFGAAIQTPTLYTITEYWEYAVETKFVDSIYDSSASSPEGEYSYSLSSPYLANFGLAYTFGSGFISVDYELTDYSVMKFKEINTGRLEYGIFDEINASIKNFAGIEHSLRIGVEYKFNPFFSIRAGYGLITSPERYMTENGNVVTVDDFLADYDSYMYGTKSLNAYKYNEDKTHSFSFGLGYSSGGSFFADLGAKLTSYPNTIFVPYSTYLSYDSNGVAAEIVSPRISNRIKLWNVALTLGWRF